MGSIWYNSIEHGALIHELPAVCDCTARPCVQTDDDEMRPSACGLAQAPGPPSFAASFAQPPPTTPRGHLSVCLIVCPSSARSPVLRPPSRSLPPSSSSSSHSSRALSVASCPAPTMENAHIKSRSELLHGFHVAEDVGLSDEQVRQATHKHGKNGTVLALLPFHPADGPQLCQKTRPRPSGSLSSSSSKTSLSSFSSAPPPSLSSSPSSNRATIGRLLSIP